MRGLLAVAVLVGSLGAAAGVVACGAAPVGVARERERRGHRSSGFGFGRGPGSLLVQLGGAFLPMSSGPLTVVGNELTHARSCPPSSGAAYYRYTASATRLLLYATTRFGWLDEYELVRE